MQLHDARTVSFYAGFSCSFNLGTKQTSAQYMHDMHKISLLSHS